MEEHPDISFAVSCELIEMKEHLVFTRCVCQLRFTMASVVIKKYSNWISETLLFPQLTPVLTGFV